MRFVNFYSKPISMFVMAAFTIMLCFWANQSPAAPNAATDNTKARELMNKGYEAFQVYKNPSQAFSYYKQAIDLASRYFKSEALIQTAYMSHLLGNKISDYQNFIKDALAIDPERKLEPIDYQTSFREIFNDIKNGGKYTVKPAVTEPTPKPSHTKPQPTSVKPVVKNSFEQEGSIPVVKKKKKFPWLIVGAGAVTVVVLVALLSKKKTTNPPISKPKGVFLVSPVVGSAFWDYIFNQMTLTFSAQIFSNDNIGGTITNWKFIVKSGNSSLLEINPNNYNNSVYNLSGYTTNNNSLQIPANQKITLTIKHDEGNYISGNPFGQIIPDNLDFYITIMDNNGYEQSITSNAIFYFINIW